jgi:hypothetical protein
MARYFISGKLRERDTFAEGYDYRYFNCIIEMDSGCELQDIRDSVRTELKIPPYIEFVVIYSVNKL